MDKAKEGSTRIRRVVPRDLHGDNLRIATDYSLILSFLMTSPSEARAMSTCRQPPSHLRPRRWWLAQGPVARDSKWWWSDRTRAASEPLTSETHSCRSTRQVLQLPLHHTLGGNVQAATMLFAQKGPRPTSQRAFAKSLVTAHRGRGSISSHHQQVRPAPPRPYL
jgi:hypothetical protein